MCCDSKVASASPRYHEGPDFTRQTAWKEIETFVGNLDPDNATREELYIYQEYLEGERALVQRNLSVIGLAERLYDRRTAEKREIKVMKDNIKYNQRRLKELGVEEPKPKEKPVAKAKAKASKSEEAKDANK